MKSPDKQNQDDNRTSQSNVKDVLYSKQAKMLKFMFMALIQQL